MFGRSFGRAFRPQNPRKNIFYKKVLELGKSASESAVYRASNITGLLLWFVVVVSSCSSCDSATLLILKVRL